MLSLLRPLCGQNKAPVSADQLVSGCASVAEGEWFWGAGGWANIPLNMKATFLCGFSDFSVLLLV